MLMLAGQQQQQQPHGPEAGGGGGGGPAAAGGGSSGGGGPSAVVAPGSPSGSASDDGSWQGGGGCEEVTCAWGVVPLAQLLQKGGGGGGTRQVIQLSGGSPGAPCDIAPADILRRRSGWLAALGGGGGGPPRTTLTLTSLPLSGLRVAERQALGRLPLTIVAPRAAVALLVAWRSALAAAVLATASRAHLSAGAGAGSLEAPGGPGAALAALSALAAEPGFLGSPGHMPAAAGGVAALLASAFEAEARAVLVSGALACASRSDSPSVPLCAAASTPSNRRPAASDPCALQRRPARLGRLQRRAGLRWAAPRLLALRCGPVSDAGTPCAAWQQQRRPRLSCFARRGVLTWRCGRGHWAWSERCWGPGRWPRGGRRRRSCGCCRAVVAAGSCLSLLGCRATPPSVFDERAQRRRVELSVGCSNSERDYRQRYLKRLPGCIWLKKTVASSVYTVMVM